MNYKKYTLLFIVLLSFLQTNLFAQANDYAKQWKQVDELIKKGLTKSALDESVKIYETAKKDNNDPQIIKALLFRITLNRNLEENANVKSIALVEKEIQSAKEPARSILNSILAEMYWNFLQQNRYKLYNRTQTVDFKKDDVLTWGLQDLHKKIGALYLSSIKEEKLLQQTKLEPLEAIIIKGNVRYLRPTLYDLLAHRALDYFKNDERDITKPAYAFEIKDEKALAPAKEFASHKFINKDSSSLHYYALLIYQKLLNFHIADAKPDALIDADIQRLSFVKQYGVMNNKDELYIRALQNIIDAHPNNPAVAQASFFLIQEIYNSAVTEDKKAEKKYTVKYAKELLENLIKKSPGSEGGINAKNLLTGILHKELNLTSEKVNVPGESFRTLVTYKNIASINLRIIELTPEFKKLLEANPDNEQLWNTLTSQKPIKSWKQTLPLPEDYKSHSTEIKVDALPIGEYALLASAAEDFNLTKNPLSIQYFHVSNISYVNNGREYFVLDRTTGKPLPGAKVQVWNQRYDYTSRKSIFEKLELLSADKNG
ncbi:MAG: alpha-2-macroglobulin, partial [Chitinophagaceae bacterium]|nr:alpha-2-macroglobulin [Chitinophagaceae bacterium]